MERLGGSSDLATDNNGDQESFLASTRTQLVWGENALLCGDFDEAARTFLGVIISFEQNQEAGMKDRSSTTSSSTSSSMSVPLEGCRVSGQPSTHQHVPPQDSQQTQQELRQCRRHQQIATLLGSALYGLGTTYMLQGCFDHAQPALQQAVYLYWRLYGEGSPLLELARTQLHRLYCYWQMVHQERQMQEVQRQQPWLMPGAYELQQAMQQQPSDELSLTEHYRRNGEDCNDYCDQTDNDVDVFDDEDDDIVMFPEEFEFDAETDELDEHHACYCPGEICRMFSRSVRHAAAA